MERHAAEDKRNTIRHKQNIVLLKRGPQGNKNLFLVHDGTGRVEGYFRLALQIHNQFTVYGISLDESIGLVPWNTTVENLAESYVDQIKRVQPKGPYFICGWSIGGVIALEIVRQLEKENDVKLCVMFDTPPPGYYPVQNKELFSVDSETEFICDFITNEKLRSDLKNSKDVGSFWNYIKENLKEEDFDKKAFIDSDRQGWAAIIPNAEQTPLHILFYGINVIRTLHSARVSYFPDSKIHTKAKLFNAEDSPIINFNEWDKYCESTESFSISGDHYSIFIGENLNGVIEKLNGILEDIG